MYACFDFFELSVRDGSVAFLVLAHESWIDAEVTTEGTDVEHRVIFKERGDVKMKFDFGSEFGRNRLATLDVIAADFLNGVKEIFFSLLYGIAGADKRAVFAVGIVGDIGAVRLFFNTYFHIG